jgi:hypothetical protein
MTLGSIVEKKFSLLKAIVKVITRNYEAYIP